MPRIRIDQMLSFNWKFLVPISLVLLSVVAILDKMFAESVSGIGFAAIMLTANVLIAWGALELLRRKARRDRLAAEAEEIVEVELSAEVAPAHAAHH